MKISKKKNIKKIKFSHNKHIFWIIIALFLLLIALLITINIRQKEIITNFEECIAAGNPAMESYPRQCRDPISDRTFVEVIDNQIIGGDTDEHDCLIATGHSWNETKQKCVREWEEINKYYCTEEDRVSEMCTFLYDPVCANAYEIDVEPETKSNGCVACQDETVEYYIKGECFK